MQEMNFPVLKTQSARLACKLALMHQTRRGCDNWTDADEEVLVQFETWLSQQLGTTKHLKFEELNALCNPD